MWNRQREAEEAREKLARAAEDKSAPNRNPPAVEDDLARTPAPIIDIPATAAE
jgi:ATP-binding cassette subfamily B protein